MRKALAILTLILLLVATTMGVYYNFVYLPEKRLEERIKPLIDAGLTREEALKFNEIYGDWAPYNKTAIGFARYWIDYPVASEAILKTSGSLKYAATSLDLVIPNIANKTLTQDTLIDFIVEHPLLVKDDGLNATDMRLIKYYVHLPGIVDKVIKKIKSQEDRLFALDELTPYISKPLTEEQTYHLIEKWYPELFKQCKEKGISVVLGDVDEDGVNHYDEIFIHGTDPHSDDWLPLIKDLKWEPTRVVNSKVYDGIVSFVAEDPKLSEAYLIFAPKNYTHLPKEAFPQESSRRFALKPVDGKFDGKIEEFLANITGINGGREYDIEIVVRDKAGNNATASLTTPYIREFENIAPLDDVLVMMPYYLWYRRDKSNWRDGHKYMPLLGEYTSDDPLVMSKDIDVATGHGADVFLVSWGGYESGDLKYFDDNLKLLFNNTLSNDILIGILYEPGRLKTTGNPEAPWEIDLSDPQNLQRLNSDFKYLARTYFNRERYFKKDSKPFVYLWDSAAFIKTVDAIREVRSSVKELCGSEPFLVSDHAHILPIISSDPFWNFWFENAKQFDGITSWLGGYSEEGDYYGGSYEKQLEILYSRWKKWAIENGIKLITCTAPEFDGRFVSWGNPYSIPLERTPEKLRERLSICLRYSEWIIPGTFNDHFESTTYQPTKEYDLKDFEILKSALSSYRK